VVAAELMVAVKDGIEMERREGRDGIGPVALVGVIEEGVDVDGEFFSKPAVGAGSGGGASGGWSTSKVSSA